MGYKRDPITDAKKLKTLRISPSSINLFKQCPKKWFYNYVLALPEPTTFALLRGSAVHQALEDVFNAKYYPSGEAFRPSIMKKAKNVFQKEWDDNIKDFDMTVERKTEKDKLVGYDESIRMIERFINEYVDDIQEGIRIKKYSSESQGYYYTRPRFRELWIDDQFKATFNDKWKRTDKKNDVKEPFEDTLNVGGFIDSVQKNSFEDNKEVILIDYKTSSLYKEALKEEYVLQLAIYAYLWEKQVGTLPKYGCINYLKYRKNFYIAITPSLVEMAKREIRNMRNDIVLWGIDEKKYISKPSKLCDWCYHKERCGKCEIQSNK